MFILTLEWAGKFKSDFFGDAEQVGCAILKLLLRPELLLSIVTLVNEGFLPI